MNKPKVSILCWAYNQENYIRETLDGFFKQKTNFPIEIILHDDASTDNTANIMREYEAKYPDVIRAIYQTENQFNKVSFVEDLMFPMVKGEYVAFCEGDDYWTDENKLQKQVDFLDKNTDCSMCFHPVLIKYEGIPLENTISPTPEERKHKTLFDTKDIIPCNIIQTNSVLYRWGFGKDFNPAKFNSHGVFPLDWYWHLVQSKLGKIGFIDEVMSIYRRHSNGLWSQTPEQIYLKFGVSRLRLYLAMEKFFPEYNEIMGHLHVCTYATQLFNLLAEHQNFVHMNRILKLCPDCFEYVLQEAKKGNIFDGAKC